jgi:hypothetical protein
MYGNIGHPLSMITVYIGNPNIKDTTCGVNQFFSQNLNQIFLATGVLLDKDGFLPDPRMKDNEVTKGGDNLDRVTFALDILRAI